MKKYDLSIVILRGQIVHNAHIECFKEAFKRSDRVLILVGSSNSPRTIENPFTFAERKVLFDDILNNICGENEHYFIHPINDYILDDQKWVKQIPSAVAHYSNLDNVTISSVAVIGGAKNEFYISLLPKEYEIIVPELFVHIVGYKKEVIKLNATDMRKQYFCNYYEEADKMIEPLVPVETFKFLQEFRKNKWYGYIAACWGRINDLNKAYGTGPFFTCDNVIMQKDKILLIKRKNHPGKGLWAIVGGYFDNTDFSLVHGSYRELIEETNISISFEDYQKNIVETRIFDNPKRSLVARLITSASFVILPYDIEYTIKAADDALEVKWFYIDEIMDMANIMYDDHYEIIRSFLKTHGELY